MLPRPARQSCTKCRIVVTAVLLMLAYRGPVRAADTLSLDGQWAFRLDPDKAGITQKWFGQRLPDTIRLPGSTDEAKKGSANTTTPTLAWLYRLHPYAGAAWYQREIDIPASWPGQRVTLELERCHWETRVWVDGRESNMQDSLCVAHVHDLGTQLSPGRHTLTLLVDNTLKHDMGRMAHSTSEETQTNWNGVVGRIALRATAPVWIENVQVYPDLERKSARVKMRIGNSTGKPAEGMITLQAKCGGHATAAHDVKLNAADTMTTVETELALGDGARPWDEFSPSMYELTAKLTSGEHSDATSETFGMRRLGINPQKQFTLNGRTIYLRGTLECCIFPKTGYPPTDEASWTRIIEICQSYGLNHMRFHSWCPPEAAFVVADRLGFLFQVEAPCWIFDWGRNAARDKWVEEETLRILDCYGNHPSFAFMSIGNEPAGDLAVPQRLVDVARNHDPRHYYTAGTGWGTGPRDDFRICSLRHNSDATDYDFASRIAEFHTPVVAHEIGQWTIYPNLAERPKYDGVLRARNFDIVEESLRAKGLLHQATAFTRLTGLQMVEMYKEAMEAMLRTQGQAGFQLLDLHDFPGQGTALIGVLDPFWDSKGLIVPKAWRRFCGPVVPVLRMSKRVYTPDEMLSATAELAQFGPADMEGAKPVWTITTENGNVVAQGAFDTQTLPTGRLLSLGHIKVDLAKAPAPARLKVTVALQGTEIGNDWSVWIVPAKAAPAAPPGVLVATQWDEQTSSALAEGRKVLLLTRGSLANSLQGSYLPVFWSPVWFRQARSTMSVLCDPRHPALAGFPTREQTDWLWYDLLENSRSLILDDLPAGFQPVVQVIDNFARNHRLGNLLEARVGRGKLVVCSIDLTDNLDSRPAARQLLRSLYDYMGSESFDPQQAIDIGALEKLMTAPGSPFANIASARSDSEGQEAVLAVDGNPSTAWHTRWTGNGAKKKFPHEVVVELVKPVRMTGLRVLPRQDGNQNGWIKDYEVYASTDGRNWGRPLAKGAFTQDDAWKNVKFDQPAEVRFVKLVALGNFSIKDNFASVAEIELEQ